MTRVTKRRRISPTSIRELTFVRSLSSDSEDEQHQQQHPHKSHRFPLLFDDDDSSGYDDDDYFMKGKRAQSPFEKTYRKMRYRWALLTSTWKMIVSVGIAFVLINVCVGTLDVLFGYYGLSGGALPAEDGSFAVVINTYKRPQMLSDAVSHYADTCGKKFSVSKVFVVWSELENEPPDPSTFFDDSRLRANQMQSTLENRADVVIVKTPQDSLNSRFLPIQQLESDESEEAIFMVDDDIRVACNSLHNGYRAWTAFPDSLVGFYPRLARAASSTEEGASSDRIVYHSWPMVFMSQKFNFVLTKASFLHKRYLTAYWSEGHPKAIRDFVDEHHNCEDVAMALMVANITKAESAEPGQARGLPAPPIYVEGTVFDRGLFNGISTGAGHMSTRSLCLTELTKIYRAHGWVAPLDYEVLLTQYSWVHHSPGFWWQSRPSNRFEWAALGNFIF